MKRLLSLALALLILAACAPPSPAVQTPEPTPVPTSTPTPSTPLMQAPVPAIPAAELYYEYEPTHIPRELIALLCEEGFDAETLAVGEEMYGDEQALWIEYSDPEEAWLAPSVMGVVADWDNDGVDDIILSSVQGTGMFIYPALLRNVSDQWVRIPQPAGNSRTYPCTVLSYEGKNYIYRSDVDRCCTQIWEGFYLSYYENGVELENFYVDRSIIGLLADVRYSENDGILDVILQQEQTLIDKEIVVVGSAEYSIERPADAPGFHFGSYTAIIDSVTGKEETIHKDISSNIYAGYYMNVNFDNPEFQSQLEEIVEFGQLQNLWFAPAPEGGDNLIFLVEGFSEYTAVHVHNLRETPWRKVFEVELLPYFSYTVTEVKNWQ